MQNRNVTLALAEARDLPRLNLTDSLRLLLLIAEKQPDLYERAAVRFAGRFLLERRGARLADGALVLALLADLPATPRQTARELLRELAA